MTIRRALDAMLQSGASTDAARSGDATGTGTGAGAGPDDSAISAALDVAGFTDLPADLVGTAIGHYADTASVEYADALAPLATEASSVPFDPELDRPSEAISIDEATKALDDDHDADPMDGLDAEPAPGPESDGPDAAALTANGDTKGEATDVVNDEATDVVNDGADRDAAEYGSGSTASDSIPADAATTSAESTPSELDDVPTTESPGASMNDPFDAFDAFDTGDTEPTAWAESSELHTEGTEDTDLDAVDPTAEGFDGFDID